MSDIVGAFSMSKDIAIHWFRKGIRLHDNPALVDACSSHTAQLLPVYCLDPHFANPDTVGINRYSFLLSSLRDLDKSLRSAGSRLFVLQGKPEEALVDFVQKCNVNKVTFETDSEPYAKKRDESICNLLATLGVTSAAHHSHTLHPLDSYVAKCNEKSISLPTSYASFCKLFEQIGRPAAPLSVPSQLPPFEVPAMDADLRDELHSDMYNVPTLEQMGYHSTAHYQDFGAQRYPGGEQEALRRLQEKVGSPERAAWVREFEKPKTAPNSLEPSTTVLSPYVKFGCLSARRFYHELDRVVHMTRHTEPPVSLHGQLLWREFFYFCSHVTPHFGQMEGNPQCRQIPWERDAAKIAAWKNAATGYPFIDAIMTQLRVEGWIHHLARHAVACFLTRGDLYQHWEEGARVFDLYLLDADWALNSANWQWLSASNFFYQYFRVYSPVAFGKTTDPNGDYIRHWIPQLAKYPAKYIYSPWEAPLNVQEQSCCVVGQHYPARIVDHDVASKQCMQRMKAADDQHHHHHQDQQHGGQQSAGEGEWGGSTAAAVSSARAGASEPKGSSNNQKKQNKGTLQGRKRNSSGPSAAPAKTRKITHYLAAPTDAGGDQQGE